jgi:hypothetical protein
VEVDSVADVTEEHTASIIRDEVRNFGKLVYIGIDGSSHGNWPIRVMG